MGYRLVALDLDGTIRSQDYPISERTRTVIARITEAGAYVTLATGRMFEAAMKSSGNLVWKSPIVSFQGAQVTDPDTAEVLWHRPLEPEMVLAALEALEPSGLRILANQGHRVYVDDMDTWARSYGERNFVDIVPVGDLKEIAGRLMTRLIIVGTETEIERLVPQLNARFDSALYITRSLPYFCEILHPDGGKEKALDWICQRLGVSREETVAFGNAWNDVPMLQWAGLGVAIGGAVPEVIEVADRIAAPIEEDGAALFLEDLIAQGLIG